MRFDPSSFQAALALERGRVVLSSGDFAIPLTAKRPGGRPGGWDGTCAVVSAEDKELSEFRWSLNNSGYARRRIRSNQGVQMHRQVMGLPIAERYAKGALVVDHINHDPLDNRRENLRVCLQAQNAQNRRGGSGVSEHRGVYFNRKKNLTRPWVAYGKVDGRKRHIGAFATEQEAADVAAAWRRENLPFTTN